MNDLAWDDDFDWGSLDERDAERRYEERCSLNHAVFIDAIEGQEGTAESKGTAEFKGVAIHFLRDPEDMRDELGVTCGWEFWCGVYLERKRHREQLASAQIDTAPLGNTSMPLTDGSGSDTGAAEGPGPRLSDGESSSEDESQGYCHTTSGDSSLYDR